ncbi:MAG: NAD-dependent epimerase/dehydratase family protein [Candidatus Obscuribacterales bacterium]|nr:NAD-dependent epimerase/dehydratase family protein [Candidatus Obscuribacterales bacterium]
MSVCLITGSSGLIGSEAVRFFAQQGLTVVGIDNDMRSKFFGAASSTDWNRRRLELEVPGYSHHAIDIRDLDSLQKIFAKFGKELSAVIHCAAQPSHDWAASDPLTDFSINATGTLNLLECVRKFSPEAVFMHFSTNKVYGDRPNSLPLIELETRYELKPDHPYYKNGIDEQMSIDASVHSLFGVSKAAADLLVQEYGRYFAMKTVCFRGGCLTGPSHSGAELHGFLSYLMDCTLKGKPYTVYGYKGKQVRDNIHSRDVVKALWAFYQKPRVAEIYNLGGGRAANCSMLEAIALCEELSGLKLNWAYSEKSRVGDHIWYISDLCRFRSHYPEWNIEMGLKETLSEIRDALQTRKS